MVPGAGIVSQPLKILELAAVGSTVRFLLLPLIERLVREGFEVHAAATPGPHLEFVAETGVRIHGAPISRQVVTWRHLPTLIRLIRLMRRERFDLVHVHTPVAAALGRVAAKLARVPIVVYTAHGFYFHDRMPSWQRGAIIWVERLLGRACTDLLFTQSEEDRRSAISERIVPADRAIWIGNGVDVESVERADAANLDREFGARPEQPVIGFVGRIVREKGIVELVRAMRLVLDEQPNAILLVVGDTLESERDHETSRILRHEIQAHGMTKSIKFAGFRQDVPGLLQAMDIFVLPSYREGMPRSILEAMAAGVPVVATNIRGCREEIVDGETGYLVPVGDERALAEAILRVLSSPERREALGKAGHARASNKFREIDVLDRQMAELCRLVASRFPSLEAPHSERSAR